MESSQVIRVIGLPSCQFSASYILCSRLRSGTGQTDNDHQCIMRIYLPILWGRGHNNVKPKINKLCAWRHNMPRPSPPVGAQAPRAPPSRHNVTVLSHAEYVPRWPLQPPYALRPSWVKRPGDLDLWPFDLESGFRVTWAISMLPILVFLGLSVLDLGPMYATDRRQTKASLNVPAY